MKALHEEWFPINYPQAFYDRMKSRKVIAIGCFYRVELPANQEHPAGEELILIGTIFSKIEAENARNERLLETIDAPRWN